MAGEAMELRLKLKLEGDELSGTWITRDGVAEPFAFPSPLSKEDRADHRWYLEKLILYPGVGDMTRARDIEQRLRAWGKGLHKALVGSEDGHLLRDLMKHNGPRLLTLSSTAAEALSLPWELMRDKQGALALRGLTLRRQLDKVELSPVAPAELPLRVLLVVSRPKDTGFIDPRSTVAPMLDALDELGGKVRLSFCDPPTLATLRRLLAAAKSAGEPFHLVQFDGHGVYLPKYGVGALCFEDDEGKTHLVRGDDLGDLLQEMQVPVALLEACHTSDLSEQPVFGSVAPALLQAGVGSVIAFSHAVTVVAARILVKGFYRGLCRGDTVGAALAEGRAELRATPGRRKLRDDTQVELRDWHLPQLYQAGPDPVLVPSADEEIEAVPAHQRGREPAKDLLRRPMYGFHGRSRELLELRRKLVRHPFVALTGMGGMGKTSLAREAAVWWSRTGRRPDGAAFFSFESRQGADRAVQSLGSYLEGDAFLRLGADEQWQRAVDLFHERQVLWVWDNFESVLPAYQKGRAEGTEFPAEERDGLVRLFEDLMAGDPKGWLVVTCRPEDTGLPGIGEMELKSLTPPEALELATEILERKDVKLGRKGYERDAIEDLLEALGHHPLSLEQVLPHLKKLRPAEVRKDFRQLTARFANASAWEGRNKELLASLEFSTKRLEEARAVLPWLAWFDGGVFEDNLIYVADLDPADWSAMRAELLATALVEVDDTTQINGRPFLRFHPTLPYAAQAEDVPDVEAVRQRFVAVYLSLALNIDKTLSGKDPAGGMAVTQREEGNLRRAAALAFELGHKREGWAIADTMGRYLQMLGRTREQARWAAWTKERVGDAEADGELDQATLAAARQHAWGLFVDGKAQDAVQLLQGLVARLEGRSDEEGVHELANCRILLGRVLLNAGRSDLAIEPLEQAVMTLDSLGDERGLSVALGDLANALRNAGRHKEALAASERSLALDRKAGDHRSEAAGLVQSARILVEMYRWDEAEARYEEALEAAQRAGDSGLEATTLQNLGLLLHRQGQQAHAIEYGRQALERSLATDNRASEMRTCNLLGSAERGQGHFEAARAWFERSRELALRLGDQQQQGAVAQNLGILYRQQALKLPSLDAQRRHLLRQAVASVKESLTVWRELEHVVFAAGSLSQLGVLHLDQANLDEAEDYLKQALAIYERLNHPDVWKVYACLEEIALARGDTEAAQAWREKKEAKIAELEALASGSSPPRLPQQSGEALLALARDIHRARTTNAPVPLGASEALAHLAKAGPPLADFGAFLRAIADGAAPPPVPSGLPDELTQILKGLAEALE